jgi:hypothetical protein
VPLEELEAARGELDERTYRQEYQASFETLGVGIAYHAFDRANNVQPVRYPLCSVLGQNINGRVRILEEMILPNSNTLAACEEFLSRTKQWIKTPEPFEAPEQEDARELYEELLERYQSAPLNVYVYGDATGSNGRPRPRAPIGRS